MAPENKSKSSNGSNSTNKNNNKKGRHRYLPHNKPVKKGSYPLRPGVQGFFITCDGGRERQASHEAINVLDSFYEELVHGKDLPTQLAESPDKPLNKKTKFTYSDSSSSDNDEDVSDDDVEGNQKDVDGGGKDKLGPHVESDANHESSTDKVSDPNKEDIVCHDNKVEENTKDGEEDVKCREDQAVEVEEPPAKKQCLEIDTTKRGSIINGKIEEKSIDKLIEAELKELGDKSKRIFNNIDSGCNGVVFVQMRKRDGDPSPKDIVQHMMTSVASTKKHLSRYMLRVLPVEVSCYASEEEITNAIKPLIAQYFPVGKQTPDKFAVLYEARANTGIDRMKIINAVAKSVPGPHKVDLNNPDKNIVVQIVKTVCLIGVVEKYKELSKYNLRQLSSST